VLVRGNAFLRWVFSLFAVVLIAATLVAAPAVVRRNRAQAAMTLPSGFQSQVVFSGLTAPSNFAFANDGRVFVAERRGVIKVFDGLDDTTPTVFADLQTEVDNTGDRGLLGLALAPNFPVDPYVYVLYSLDAPIGGTPPRWNDTCPTPPGQNQDGCVIGARLSRLKADGDVMTGTEQVLIEDWCQQYSSHSIGTIAFGPDGALYVGGGDGASYNFADYGQGGGSLSGTPTPKNPCGDPPAGVGGTQTPPTAEGGALRAQDAVAASDTTSLDGGIARVNPADGQPLSDNPNIGASDVNARRLVSYGMRNPFRFTFRPGTTDMWIGDVGWNTWEEIDRNPDARGAVKNFGWPCYEGNAPQPGYQALNLNLCNTLYNSSGAATPPVYTYQHGSPIVSGDGCQTGGGAVSGLAFYNGGSLPGPVGTYPAKYDGALFFSDYARQCIVVMLAGANGLPDPTKVERFGTSVGAAPVTLVAGPGGDIYWGDIATGTINRIRYFAGNRPPVAVIHTTATNGSIPLTVQFDGTASSDADNDPLTYAWDLDGDGNYNDSTSPTPSFTYNDAANHTVRLKVTDSLGASDTTSVVISAGNTAPSVSLDAPSASLVWKVGDTITYSATGTDAEDGTLPASAFHWAFTIEHCPSGICHEHAIDSVDGVKSGSFIAPDHEWPSHLRVSVTVTDSGGLTASNSVDIFPQTTTLTLGSNVSGATLAVDDIAGPQPVTSTVVVGSSHVVTAPMQQLGGSVYDFDGWSDSGAQTHNIIVNGPTTLNATLSQRTLSPSDVTVNEPASGSTANATVTVTLNRAATRPVSVEWNTQAGTATAGSDYTTSSGTVVIPTGSTSQTLTVPVIGDNTAEPDETFAIMLSAPQNATLAKTSATVTIKDNQGPIVSVGVVSVTEGDSGSVVVQVPVNLSTSSTQTVTVPFESIAFGATSGVDYSAPATGTLTFAPGQTSLNVPVTVFGDKLDENDEAMLVHAISATNASVPAGGTYGGVRILDNDPPVTIAGGLGKVVEGNSGTTQIHIPVTLNTPSALTVKVNWATASYQADASDFLPASGTLTFPAGTTAGEIIVTVYGDTTPESNELFVVGMSSPVNGVLGGIGPGLAFGQITNDD
jgi:glucose/arabinose dehydrogenase/PKD repeat protein